MPAGGLAVRGAPTTRPTNIFDPAHPTFAGALDSTAARFVCDWFQQPGGNMTLRGLNEIGAARHRHRAPRQRSFAARAIVATAVESLEARRLFALAVTPYAVAPTLATLPANMIFEDTGINITGMNYVGAANQGGAYTGLIFQDKQTALVMDDGLLLTSGHSTDALAPNDSGSAGESLTGQPGDTDLTSLVGANTFDANALTLTFTTDPGIESIIFDFVFGSEEYHEFVGSSYNDAFAAYLDGVQISFDADGKPLTVNNNFMQYNNSGTAFPGSTLITFPAQYDGFTPHIRTSAPLNNNTTHTLKFVIADAGDHAYDSGVFLAGLQGSARPLTGPLTELPKPGILTFDESTLTVDEAAGTANVVINRVGDSSGKVTATYSTLDLTAATGEDFTATTGIVEFFDGETTKTITIPIIDDGLIEVDEELRVRLSNPTGGVLLPANPNGVLKIISDDAIVSADAAAISVSEDAGFATITLTREGALHAAAMLDYATSDGTAVAGADYTATIGTLTFLAGESTTTVNVPITWDPLLNEATETFTMTFSNIVTGGHTLGTPSQVTVSIINVAAYSPTYSAVQLSVGAIDVREDAGFATITIDRIGAAAGVATVDYATADATATAGVDYTAVSGTLTFADGEASKTVQIPVVLDADTFETEETFGFALSNFVGTDQELLLAATTVNLINVDYIPPTALTGPVFATDRRGITSFTMQFSEPLGNPTDPRGYTIWNRGADGRNGTGRDNSIRVKSVAFDPATNTATITPIRRLPFNKVFGLSVNAPFIQDRAGNYLDANADGTGGDSTNSFFGIGRKLTYIDADGDKVILQVRNGGMIELLRDFNGEANTVTLIGDTGASTVTGLLRQTRQRGGGFSGGVTGFDYVGRAGSGLFNGNQFITTID
jgi:hypothetical protein